MERKKRQQSKPFWPDQLFYDTLIASFILLLLFTLSVYAPAPISGPADPLDTTYIPKPEWNFLFLYETLKFFPAKFEAVGTMGIPLLVILVLFSLPFIDRTPERNPARRPVVMIGGFVFVVAMFTLTIAGYYSKPEITEVAPPPVASKTHMSASTREGQNLFQSLGCIGCHRVHGKGGAVGPELSSLMLQDKSRQRLMAKIRDPKSVNPQSIMPSFSSLDDGQVNALVDYLLSLAYRSSPVPIPKTSGAAVSNPSTNIPQKAKPDIPGKEHVQSPLGLPGRAADLIGSANHGALLFKKNCEYCHGPAGTGKVANPGSQNGMVPPLKPINPSLFHTDPQTFASNVDRIIQHGLLPSGPNPALHMLAYGDTNSLTQQEISDLEAYILSLNGVNRAKLEHPGLHLQLFLILAVSIFGLTGICLLGFWIRSRSKVE